MKLSVSLDDLFNWSKAVEDAAKASKQTISKALNDLGNSVLRQMRIDIQQRTGLPSGDVEKLLAVTPATSDDLSWSVDSSAVFATGLDDPYKLALSYTERRALKDMLLARYRIKQEGRIPFPSGQLVKILTAEDERVCEVCQDAAEGGPYTIEEAQQLIPFHSNCRCSVMPYSSGRRLPVTYTTPSGPAPRVGQQLMTSKEMARFLGTAIRSSIKVKKK